MTQEEFQLKVVDQLARIETKLDSTTAEFEAHEVADRETHRRLYGSVESLRVDAAVAKRAGGKVGAGTAAGLVAVVEGIRALFMGGS